MPPTIVMAVGSIESRAVNITVHDTPHERTAVPIDHGSIDFAVDDAANDGGATIAVVVSKPATIAIAVVPSGLSRSNIEAT
jgi:hypothetical protein